MALILPADGLLAPETASISAVISSCAGNDMTVCCCKLINIKVRNGLLTLLMGGGGERQRGREMDRRT
jgi:hypothetical protein